MHAELREKAGLVYNVVESVVLTLSVGLVCWTSTKLIDLSERAAADHAQLNNQAARIENMDMKGSRGLESQATRLEGAEKRIEKLESAVIGLQSAPGELKAIGIRLDALADGQKRIESVLTEHMRNGKSLNQ